jgi:hypothetical protein
MHIQGAGNLRGEDAANCLEHVIRNVQCVIELQFQIIISLIDGRPLSGMIESIRTAFLPVPSCAPSRSLDDTHIHCSFRRTLRTPSFTCTRPLEYVKPRVPQKPRNHKGVFLWAQYNPAGLGVYSSFNGTRKIDGEYALIAFISVIQ